MNRILSIILIAFFIILGAIIIYAQPPESQQSVQNPPIDPIIVQAIEIKANELQKSIEISIESKISDVSSKLIKKIDTECNKEFIWKDISTQHFNGVKHVFDETRNSIEILIKYSLFIISIVMTIFAILVGKQFKDFKEIQENFKKSSEIVKDKIEELKKQEQELMELKDKAQKVNKEIEVELSNIIKFKEDMKKKDEEIYQLLELQKAIKNKKIIWAIESDNIDDSEIIKELQDQGFKNINEWKVFDETKIPAKEDCDFMVYSYSKSDKSSERLDRVLKYLCSTDRRIPLIIYTYNNGKRADLPGEYIVMLNTYRNYSLSTTPGNFKSVFNSTIIERGSMI